MRCTERKIRNMHHGFCVDICGRKNEFLWKEITTLVAFKLNKRIVDELCLRVATDEKSIVLSEELEGWSAFVGEMEKQFPEMDKHWQASVVHLPFEKKETVLLSHKKKELSHFENTPGQNI